MVLPVAFSRHRFNESCGTPQKEEGDPNYASHLWFIFTTLACPARLVNLPTLSATPVEGSPRESIPLPEYPQRGSAH